MLTTSIVLILAFCRRAEGSIQRSSQDAEDKPNNQGWAWKDSKPHAPPHMKPASEKASDSFEPHWLAGKASKPETKDKDEAFDAMPMGAQVPRTALQGESDALDSKEALSKSVVSKTDMGAKHSGRKAGQSTDLQGTLEDDLAGSMMQLEEFMPKCLAHTKSLIADLDYNYGDAQLETILLNWCKSAEEFPNTRGRRKVIGYKNHQSCTAFTDDLKNARFHELRTTSDKGYRKFCNAFYEHHGGFTKVAPPPRVKEGPPRFSGASWAGVSTAVMVLVLFLA